jgi:DNA-binding PadR family transcriptional regulator
MPVPTRPRSPLWMVVLALVTEEPMHPYRMQVLIKERGKDQIANVTQRNSVYQTIAALLRAGLIAVRETARDERRPERTVYEVTPEGQRTLDSWMRAVLSAPARDFPDFPAALSLVAGLQPEDVRASLEMRMGALEQRLAELETPIPNLPRLFLIEDEYRAAMVRAEIEWLRSVIDDLRSGRLTWSEQWLRQIAKKLASQAGDAARPKQVAAASTARNAALVSASRKLRDTKRAIRRSRPR